MITKEKRKINIIEPGTMTIWTHPIKFQYKMQKYVINNL